MLRGLTSGVQAWKTTLIMSTKQKILNVRRLRHTLNHTVTAEIRERPRKWLPGCLIPGTQGSSDQEPSRDHMASCP